LNRRKLRTRRSAGSAGRGTPEIKSEDGYDRISRWSVFGRDAGGRDLAQTSRHDFFRPNEQIGIAAEYASSFALDNGAFSLWSAGQRRPAWDSYYRWVEAWRNHPGFDFAIIPDVIDGSEEENDDLLAEWPFFDGVPVYHLHEFWADF